jgi:hypothetical protein
VIDGIMSRIDIDRAEHVACRTAAEQTGDGKTCDESANRTDGEGFPTAAQAGRQRISAAMPFL